MALLGAALGGAVAIALLALYGAADIGRALVDAGWGVLAFVAFHLTQIAFSSLAWKAVLPARSAPGVLAFLQLRWIREAVNALLPVAQIGGEIVGARVLAARGVTLSLAGASVTVDLTLEVATQIAFTLLGLGLLIHRPGQEVTAWMIGGAAASAGAVALFVLAQRMGVFGVVERGLIRFSRTAGWQGLGDVRGLHDAIVSLYRDPARWCRGGAHHLISWLLGGLEVMLGLHLVGVSVDLRDGIIIESLGQALRTIGFAVPAALGVQEGGYVLVCGLLGISPQAAIELSLLKRIREVALGVPGLIAWQVIERQRLANRAARGRAAQRQSELAP